MRHIVRIAQLTGRLLVPAFVAFAFLLFAALALGPRTGAYRTFTVLTGSMAPDMPVGSVVVSTPAPIADVRVGDVITYRIPVEDRRVVTHRVVEVVRGGDRPVVRTKGDANGSVDPWTAELKGSRVWRARATVPKLGLVLEDLRDPRARRLLVLAVPAFLAVLWLKDIWRREEETVTTADVVAAPATDPRGAIALVALLSLGAACARGRA